jgi:membrane-bound lytic murein transglycosylase A
LPAADQRLSRSAAVAIALFFTSFVLTLGLSILSTLAVEPESPPIPPLQRRPLEELQQSLDVPALLGLDDQLYSQRPDASNRRFLLEAIANSLRYLDTPAAATAYAQYPVEGITLDRVRRSLERFRALVQTSRSAVALQRAVQREFDFYQSVGRDGQGTVQFTGYFEPTYTASRQPTAEFRYPLYRLPSDLAQWPRPHPTRAELEGSDGLGGSNGRLRGLELVWLRDRLEAFLVQVQGSARLQLTDGGTLTVGYAGRTDYPYVSLGRELIKDGKLPEGLTLPVLLRYFQENPDELDEYIPRNNRFVFFRETAGAPPIGSLNVPVTAERSIATDKTLMPPGALTLIQTQIPYPTAGGQLVPQVVNRYMLDQDTGGAIRGPGRVDIFMGTGPLAGDRAGLITDTGQLFYLLLKQ